MSESRALWLSALVLGLVALAGCDCEGNTSGPTISTPVEDAGDEDAGDQDEVGTLDGSITPEDASDADDAELDAMADVEDDADEPWPWPWPEPLCESTADCGEGLACVGGACIAPVDPLVWEFSEQMAVVTSIYVPSGAEEACCFDLNGNGFVDNQAATMIDLYDQVSDEPTPLREGLNQMLRESGQNVVFEFRATADGAPGEVDLGMMAASTDLDSDAEPDFRGDALASGDIEVLIDPRSFGEYGAHVRFPRAQLDEDGRLVTTAAGFETEMPFGERCSWKWQTEPPLTPFGERCRSELPRRVRYAQLHMEGDLNIDEVGVKTVDSQITVGGEEVTVGGLKVGGYFHLDLLADVLNASYSDNCGCIGLEPTEDLFVTGVRDGTYFFECDPDFAEPDLSACDQFNRSCPGIAQLCAQLPILAGLAEHDVDGDGVLDGLSFGFRMSLAPAKVAASGPFLPPKELCDTETDEDGDGVAACADRGCWDDVSCGAFGWGERCHNGVDEDDDGDIDCDDRNCAGNLACE